MAWWHISPLERRRRRHYRRLLLNHLPAAARAEARRKKIKKMRLKAKAAAALSTSVLQQPPPPTPPPLPAPPAPAPAIPAMMNRRPKRARQPAGAVPSFGSDDEYNLPAPGAKGRRLVLDPQHMPLLPPLPRKQETWDWQNRQPREEEWSHDSISRKRASRPLVGFRYGPRNTCAVDTFLTLMRHALTPKERELIKRMGAGTAAAADSAPSAAEESSTQGSSSSSSTSSTALTVYAAAASAATAATATGSASASRSTDAMASADGQQQQQQQQQQCAECPTPTANALFAALKALKRGEDPERAKRIWYTHLCETPPESEQHEPTSPPPTPTPPNTKRLKGRVSARQRQQQQQQRKQHSLECKCTCPCANCESGMCVKCSRCSCNRPWLIGHCFGLMEQFFTHLLPPTLSDSPFHFKTRQRWQCGMHPECAYEFTAANPWPHLPLLLTAVDVSELLAAGVPPEVGALASAHLSSAPYDYGTCPRCGQAQLCARACEPVFSPLLLVELGRLDGGIGADSSAASCLPWTPEVAPRCVLRVGSSRQAYTAVAVVYNDGSHWWGDMLSSSHFKRQKRDDGGPDEPLGYASYRYDGLEAEGRLRFCGYSLHMTSDPRHVSVVLYRKADPSASDEADEAESDATAAAAAAAARGGGCASAAGGVGASSSLSAAMAPASAAAAAHLASIPLAEAKKKKEKEKRQQSEP